MTTYRTMTIDGIDLFYREAGPQDAPALVLLHGFPSSSHMFRNLLPALSETFHLVAPDYPGFGNSDTPTPDQFEYTFAHLTEVIEHWLQALGLNRFSLYVHDYGAPVGFRLATRHPDWIQAIITQNGNAYEDGLTPMWEPLKAFWKERTAATEASLRGRLTRQATIWQYTHGVRDRSAVSPDGWNIDQYGLDRPGNDAIQLALFYDYRTNLALYPQWQAYFREFQPPMLVIWGKRDQIFGLDGATAFRRDLPNSEVYLLDTGHFALEEDGSIIAEAHQAILESPPC